jgi:hypothetical protein
MATGDQFSLLLSVASFFAIDHVAGRVIFFSSSDYDHDEYDLGLGLWFSFREEKETT